MALRAVTEHPKFARLKVALKLGKGATLGYLECVWHFCGKYTPQGNIGKYSAEEIEAWCEWDGEEGALIAALIKSRWLEIHPVNGLIVHDWHKHADDATKLALKRAKLGFLTHPDGEGPDPEKEPIPSIVSRQCPDSVTTESGLPEPEPVPEPVPVNQPTVGSARKPKSDKWASAPNLNDHLPKELRSERLWLVWTDFNAHRRDKKADPYTVAGLGKLASALVNNEYTAAHIPALVERCMAANWKGIPPEEIERFAKTPLSVVQGGKPSEESETEAEQRRARLAR